MWPIFIFDIKIPQLGDFELIFGHLKLKEVLSKW